MIAEIDEFELHTSDDEVNRCELLHRPTQHRVQLDGVDIGGQYRVGERYFLAIGHNDPWERIYSLVLLDEGLRDVDKTLIGIMYGSLGTWQRTIVTGPQTLEVQLHEELHTDIRIHFRIKPCWPDPKRFDALHWLNPTSMFRKHYFSVQPLWLPEKGGLLYNLKIKRRYKKGTVPTVLD